MLMHHYQNPGIATEFKYLGKVVDRNEIQEEIKSDMI
jgi:hypothetical protein